MWTMYFELTVSPPETDNPPQPLPKTEIFFTVLLYPDALMDHPPLRPTHKLLNVTLITMEELTLL